MKYHNRYLKLRKKCVQIFDAMYFEPENHSKCHKRNWERMGCFVFGISYETYLKYLKSDTSNVPEVPSEAVDMMQALIDELLSRENHPINLSRTAQSDRENEARVREIIENFDMEMQPATQE